MDSGELTLILDRVKAGDTQAEADLFSVAYGELRSAADSLMSKERGNHTLQPSALINEAALRLIRQNAIESMPNRAYFFGAMVRAMRRVLVDHARARNAQRRGDGNAVMPLDQAIDVMQKESRIDLVALDDALSRLGEQRKRTAEIVELRFFGGLSLPEIADSLSVSVATVNREWRYARAWLHEQIG